jgi:nucleosome binding factor SPN SPT16 subunit
MPTVNCLVSLTETPFFVCTIEEIEVVFFERIGAMIKNFDLVIIYKDYTRQVSFINAIPIHFKDQIKFWLDSNDIIFFEGEKSLKWDKILKRIRDDPETFVNEEGGWGAFADDDEAIEQENEIENQNDSSFDSAEIEGEEESSDWSGEEEEAEEGVEEDSEGIKLF